MCVRRLALVAALAAAGFAGQAAAQAFGPDPAATDNNRAAFYAGLGLELLHVEHQGTGVNGNAYEISTRPLALTAKLGWNPVDWLGVEGFVSTGIHEDPNTGSFAVGLRSDEARTGETELKLAYGLALKPRYTFQFDEGETTIDLYALVGYSAYEYEGDFVVNSGVQAPTREAHFTIDDSSIYYGAGIGLVGLPASLTLQYVQYADQDNHQITAWQVSVIKYF